MGLTGGRKRLVREIAESELLTQVKTNAMGLAISFAVPAFAQQKDTIISQIDEQIVKKFDEAFNNRDAAAVAALYTEDAIQVTPQGGSPADRLRCGNDPIYER
jgi:hypothetical protein